jgi:hypothetical protein
MTDNQEGDFSVTVRPIEPELRIIPCQGFIPAQDGGSVSFQPKPLPVADQEENPKETK